MAASSGSHCYRMPEGQQFQSFGEREFEDIRCVPSSSNISLSPPVSSGPIYTDGKSLPTPERPGHPVHEPTGTSEVLTFYPTWEEFQDFNAYIRKIEATGAQRSCGICKVIPPQGWHPRPNDREYSKLDQYVIKNPVSESFVGQDKIFLKNCTVHNPSKMSVAEFKKIAEDRKYQNPHKDLTGKPLEKILFDKLTAGRKPLYGADTEGTLMTAPQFNVNNLGTILDETKELATIRGVNTVYLYFGMYRASFAWHVEDMDLYSINYLHFGAPKYWFAISAESAERFEKIMEQYFPDDHQKCKAFLRHKSYLITPELLKLHNIPYGTMQQNANEFIITFPKGYHMGFNLGYNCAESTNFATDRWIDFGKNAIICSCGKNRVEINMINYMRKYRPTEFPSWNAYWYGGGVVVAPIKPGKRRSDCGAAVVTTKRGRKSRSSMDSSSTSLIGDANDATTIGFLKIQPTPAVGGTIAKQNLWRARFGGLCSDYGVDFEAEKQLNRSDGHMFPHCSVCNYLQPLNSARRCDSIPSSSTRNMRSLSFAKDDRLDCSNDPHKDALVTCSSCRVTVHPACYGGYSNSDNPNWQCYRCNERPSVVIQTTCCCLCDFRGGALIPCMNGSDAAYAHVFCAIMNRTTSFDRAIGPTKCYKKLAVRHTIDRKDVNTSVRLTNGYMLHMGMQQEMAKYECGICGYLQEGLVNCYLCPRECVSATLAHATCARLAGYTFQRAYYPKCTVMICDKHKPSVDSLIAADCRSPALKHDSVVIVKNKQTKELTAGVVSNIAIRDFLCVIFLDGTLSNEIQPSEIITCNCINCDKITHNKGAVVKLQWDDGSICEAYTRGSYQITRYVVQLLSKEEVEYNRADLYPDLNNLPKTVKAKLRANPDLCELFHEYLDIVESSSAQIQSKTIR